MAGNASARSYEETSRENPVLIGPMGNESSRSLLLVVADFLTRDTLVLVYLTIAAIEALIYGLPLLSPDSLAAFGASPFQIPFVATTALAGLYGLGRVLNPEERMFWRCLALGSLGWLATLTAIALKPATEWRLFDEVWAHAAYLFFYSAILFAAEIAPHRAGLGGKRKTERQLRWAGVLLLVAGWFAYFVVAPMAVDRAFFSTNLPSALLFITVDAAITLRFGWWAWSCGSTRWRVLYGMLTLAGVSMLATDSLDALKALGLLALPNGAGTDLWWIVPPFFLLLAFRLRSAALPRDLDVSAREREASTDLDPVRVGSFLVSGAMSFPLVHFVLHTWHPFSADLERAHQLVVLLAVVLLGTLAVLAYRILERQRLAAERTRIALEERVRQARTLEAISRFAGVVADEYTVSLKAIDGFVDRVIDTLSPSEPLHGDARRAADLLSRATEFTKSLRAVSRRQGGRPSRIDLTEELSNLLPAVRDAVGPSVRIETEPSREPCTTVIDPAHFRALVLDLATNARDAMPDGGRWRLETGIVDLTAEAAIGMAIRPGRYATLSVRDTGTGIPKDVLAHIFEPFYSTRQGERVSGLGLATLYAIVRQYGGCVNVTSEPGDTMFEILLPSPR